MSSQRRLSSMWQLLIIAVALLLCVGGSHSASGQIPNLTAQVSSPNPAPNPQVYVRRFAGKRPDNRSKPASGNLPQPSSDTRANEKQQAIEQAIADGNQARDKNNYEQALDHYRKAETLNPQEARAFYGMGNVYSDLYCYDSTIESYLKALDLKKDYLEAHIGLGWAYINKERYDDAWGQFQEALKLKPKSVEANIGLGSVYAKKKKYQEAIEQINLVVNDKLIEDKDRASALAALGDVYWLQEKWPEATARYEKAISLNPN